MMINVVEVAKNAKEIVKAEYEVLCPQCQEKQYSPFDKLFTKAYEHCVDCTPAEELEQLSANIFTIVEAL